MAKTDGELVRNPSETTVENDDDENDSVSCAKRMKPSKQLFIDDSDDDDTSEIVVLDWFGTGFALWDETSAWDNGRYIPSEQTPQQKRIEKRTRRFLSLHDFETLHGTERLEKWPRAWKPSMKKKTHTKADNSCTICDREQGR